MGHNKLDLGEFWLMFIVQICCLAKVSLQGHKDLNNLVYPVSSLGGAEQLSHVNPKDWQYVLSLILKEMDLQEYGTNVGEGSLCELSVGRVCKIHDYVFPNHIGSTSAKLLKNYGSDCWELFLENLLFV
jgi:hypothetical protein